MSAVLAVPAIIGIFLGIAVIALALLVAVLSVVPIITWFVLADSRWWKTLATRGIEHRN